jgi:hypothetical protein
MIIKGKFLVNKCNIWQVFNWVDWVLIKNFYDALYLGTNFVPLNALYFRTEGVDKIAEEWKDSGTLICLPNAVRFVMQIPLN